MTDDQLLAVLRAELKASRALIRSVVTNRAAWASTAHDARLYQRWTEASAACALAEAQQKAAS